MRAILLIIIVCSWVAAAYGQLPSLTDSSKIKIIQGDVSWLSRLDSIKAYIGPGATTDTLHIIDNDDFLPFGIFQTRFQLPVNWSGDRINCVIINDGNGKTIGLPDMDTATKNLVYRIYYEVDEISVFNAVAQNGETVEYYGMSTGGLGYLKGEYLIYGDKSENKWHISCISGGPVGFTSISSTGEERGRSLTVFSDVNSTAALAIGNADGVSGNPIISITTQASSVKLNVNAATTGNITLSGTQAIDGIALTSGNRVLVKNQSTASQNGIYLVSSGSWTRATDMDTDGELNGGIVVYVRRGLSNGGKYFRLSTPTEPSLTLGSSAIAFDEVLITGTGLTDGDKGDIDVSANGATWTVDTSAITAIKIAANAIDSTKVGTGALSVTDIGQHGASSGQVLKWNGTQWAAANDSIVIGAALKDTSIVYNHMIEISPDLIGRDSLAYVGAAGIFATPLGSNYPTAGTGIFSEDGTPIPFLGRMQNSDLPKGVSVNPNYVSSTLKHNFSLGARFFNQPVEIDVSLDVNNGEGTAGQVLTSGGAGQPLTWTTPSTGGPDSTTARNTGATGEGIYSHEDANVLNFKKLIAGSNITLTPADSSITIAASGGSDGNGIYSGSDTIPNNTYATVEGAFAISFLNGAFAISIDEDSKLLSLGTYNGVAGINVQLDSIEFYGNKLRINSDTIDASGVSTFIGFPSGGAGGGVSAPDPENIENSTFTAIMGIINQVDCSGGAITVNPPSSPSINDRFAIVDAEATADTNNITIDFDTANQKLYGAEQNYIINVAGGYVEFIYMGSTTGWVATKG